MVYYYTSGFSLITKPQDKIEDLNKFLKSIGSRQVIEKRPYKRQFKFALIHFNDQGKFIDTIFDMGDVIHCKPFNSIIKK